MQVVAKFFALQSQITGLEELIVELPNGSTVAQLIDLLNKKFKKLNLDILKTIVLVEKNKATAETVLNNGDEAIILQLMSGG
jgi:molybdopterin converting factor small subunit